MSDNQISEMLTGILIFMLVILFFLVLVYIILRLKSKPNKDNDSKINKEKNNNENLQETLYNKQSIYSFMDFDKIDDNMIYRKRLNKYIMIIESQGINYDLMSGMEKNSVEQGFLQFLNTLRYPIQIYIQTRPVDLGSSILTYKEQVNKIRDRLTKKQFEYNNIKNKLEDNKTIKEQQYEILKLENLYEYGVDIIKNTERMNMNRNILRRHYYIVISYIPEDDVKSKYDVEEIKNMAFNELYTRAQSLINALNVCGINSKILDSYELAELLYIAYNRDESEVYDLKKAIKAGYDEMYSTAPNILDKRMKELNKYIEEEAIKRANEALMEVSEQKEKEREIRQKEKEKEDLIDQMAQMILESNEMVLGVDLTEDAKKNIQKKKGGNKVNEEKRKK